MSEMKVGTTVGYWSAGPPEGAAETFQLADELGFDSVWTAEAYGSDAWTPLAWWGSQTKRVKLGTGISQMSARPPTSLAMAAMTLDHLTGGRVIVGVGASNPQVVEGWYGQPFPRPLERTREYVEIMRRVFRREVVEFSGKHYQLPFEGGTGLGKRLKSTLHPYREDIPIYLGAEGPKNIALAAEVADGWLTLFFSPKMNDFYAEALDNGFAVPGARHTKADFEVYGGPLAIIVHDKVDEAADFMRPILALYIGGMGAKGTNFHNDVFVRLGYEAECHDIQEKYLAGDKPAAIAAVPTRLVEDVSMVGPLDKIKEEIDEWKKTVITSFSLNVPQREYLPELAEYVRS